MRGHFAKIAVSAAILGVAGCTNETNYFRAFYQEAGSEIETHDFGNATMQNTLTQSGERDYAIDLTRRFSADVPNTINFEFNSYVLDGPAQDSLRQQADWIKQFPEVRFRVFGYTDLVGSEGYNKRLGLRRAQAAVSFLVSQGINRSRLEAVVSYGKTQPLVYTPGPERRNRRAVTEVSGFVKNNPMVLNGKYAQIIWREYVNSAVPPHKVENTSQPTGAATGASN